MKRILIIEDNALIRDNTAELLELNDFSVETARNGGEGYEFLEANPFDLVLCDIHMPVMSGIELFNKLKSNGRNSDLTFIFMSASVQHEEKIKALNLGIDGFVEKPFDEQSLLLEIATALSRGDK